MKKGNVLEDLVDKENWPNSGGIEFELLDISLQRLGESLQFSGLVIGLSRYVTWQHSPFNKELSVFSV